MNDSLIKVLSDNLIDKIAAGEVVERPGSVVKELVENAIDAGAAAITVEIKDGGISYIRVTDNGKGIPGDQVTTAFMRHATSKIQDESDLESILTLGFRGEALSSIAAVSQIEMISKTGEALVAKRVEFQGGKLTAEQEIGGADGTTIIVRNLFYNTPARRKFLKKPGTESGYITDIVQKIALGHPEVSFRYIVNSSEVLHTNGNGELKTVILNVYGRDVAKKLIPVDAKQKENSFGITGFICKPEVARGNRNYGNFFINGRYIKSQLIQAAVEEAYKTKLPIGKFPVFALNLAIDPTLVDVNVHPTKLEVRFSDEQGIYSFAMEAVASALAAETLIPQHQVEQTKSARDFFKTLAYEAEPPKNFAMEDRSRNVLEEARPVYRIEPVPEPPNPQKTQALPLAPPEEEKMERPLFFHNYRVIGQFFKTYWLVEQEDSVYIIDQHAAHERVLYEEFLKQFRSGDIHSQRLLAPKVVQLNEGETQTLQDNMEMIRNFGFEVEEMSPGTFAVKSVPHIFRGPVSPDFFMDILDRLSAVDTRIENIFDTKLTAIATIACKAAVKGNNRLSYVEAKGLIDQMLLLENPFTCPHGRPTAVALTKNEVEKMFKRIQ